MIALNRELTNILFFFNISILSISIAHNNKNTNIDIDTLRDRSVNASTNGSRKLSTHSSISFILYMERIKT